jgi:hypothetical protein
VTVGVIVTIVVTVTVIRRHEDCSFHASIQPPPTDRQMPRESDCGDSVIRRDCAELDEDEFRTRRRRIQTRACSTDRNSSEGYSDFWQESKIAQKTTLTAPSGDTTHDDFEQVQNDPSRSRRREKSAVLARPLPTTTASRRVPRSAVQHSGCSVRREGRLGDRHVTERLIDGSEHVARQFDSGCQRIRLDLGRP